MDPFLVFCLIDIKPEEDWWRTISSTAKTVGKSASKSQSSAQKAFLTNLEDFGASIDHAITANNGELTPGAVCSLESYASAWEYELLPDRDNHASISNLIWGLDMVRQAMDDELRQTATLVVGNSLLQLGEQTKVEGLEDDKAKFQKLASDYDWSKAIKESKYTEFVSKAQKLLRDTATTE